MHFHLFIYKIRKYFCLYISYILRSTDLVSCLLVFFLFFVLLSISRWIGTNCVDCDVDLNVDFVFDVALPVSNIINVIVLFIVLLWSDILYNKTNVWTQTIKIVRVWRSSAHTRHTNMEQLNKRKISSVMKTSMDALLHNQTIVWPHIFCVCVKYAFIWAIISNAPLFRSTTIFSHRDFFAARLIYRRIQFWRAAKRLITRQRNWPITLCDFSSCSCWTVCEHAGISVKRDYHSELWAIERSDHGFFISSRTQIRMWNSCERPSNVWTRWCRRSYWNEFNDRLWANMYVKSYKSWNRGRH